MDIMELIEKYAETHATIARDLEKWGSHSVSARAKQIEYLTQIKSHISAMQEVCDAAIKYYDIDLADSYFDQNHLREGCCSECDFLLVVKKYKEAIK